jgi:hypothetical protein
LSPEPSDKIASEPSDKAASVFGGLLFFGPLILLVLGIWNVFTRDYSQHFSGVTLQRDVLYVTTRQWPLAEPKKAPAPLRWLSSVEGKIRLNDFSPQIPSGADYIIVLIHGYASLETDVASYFSDFIDYLREDAGIRAHFFCLRLAEHRPSRWTR